QHRRERDRPVVGRLVAYFVVAALDVAWRRQDGVRQELVRLEDVLLLHIHPRQREELGRRHDSLALGPDNPEAGPIREHRHGQARGMHDEARAAAENGVELVLARDREAGGASLLQAVELLVAEIPAARTLIEIAADGA